MFKLLYKNKKGVTLVELIIAVTILGLVLALTATVFLMFQREHKVGSDRWQVQNAVRLACNKFENNANLIVNSKQVDIFYDTGVEAGIVYNTETGEWTWNQTPVVLPEKNSEGDDYTYMYSTPATDQNGVYLGHLLFVRNDSTTGDTDSVLFLDTEGFGDIPVQVEFAVGTNELDKVQNQAVAYRNNSTHIYFKSGNTDVTVYETDTIYVSENLASTKTIGRENGQLIYDATWADSAYPCGWTDASITGCPTGDELKVYNGTEKTAENLLYTYTAEQVTSTGNVLRFLSPLSDKSFEKASGSATQEKPTCLNQFLFDDMSVLSETVLDNLRNFRDEVLRGTEFGDWFIHQYYYVWSPFLIEHTAFLKPVYKAIMIPVSYVCDFIADL